MSNKLSIFEAESEQAGICETGASECEHVRVINVFLDPVSFNEVSLLPQNSLDL